MVWECWSEKPQSNQNSCAAENGRIEHLGLHWQLLNDKTIISVPDEKINAVKNLTKEALKQLSQKNLLLKTLSSLVGNLNYAICCRTDRAGIELLRPLYAFVDPDFFRVAMKQKRARAKLKHSLIATQRLLDDVAPIVRTSGEVDRKLLWIFTDASSDGGPNGGPVVGAYILDLDGNVWSTKATDLPRGKRIDLYEAIAINLAVGTFHDLISGASALISIDNVLDCYAFIKASHRCPAASAIIIDTVLEFRKLRCATFYDYVTSERNCADWLTRQDLEHVGDEFTRLMNSGDQTKADDMSRPPRFCGCIKDPVDRTATIAKASDNIAPDLSLTQKQMIRLRNNRMRGDQSLLRSRYAPGS